MSDLHDKEAFFKNAREIAEGLSKKQLIEYYIAELETCCEVEEELKVYKNAFKLACEEINRVEAKFGSAYIRATDYLVDYFKKEAREELKSE